MSITTRCFLRKKYAEKVKSAYPVIKSIDPDIKVIGGVTAMVPHGWIKQIFDAGAYDYFDIFSIHPYDFDGGFNVERWRNNLVLLREMMTEYGDMKPLWLTELGWSVSGAKAGVSEPEAASYGVQSYAMIQSENLADLMIWYDLHNDGLTDGNEHNFGAIRYTEGVTLHGRRNFRTLHFVR